jgi:hypothetical protein
MHLSYSLHSLDCNLADGEYVLIPEQGAVHEEDQEQAPETAIEDLPRNPRNWRQAPVLYITVYIYATLLHLNVCRLVMCT